MNEANKDAETVDDVMSKKVHRFNAHGDRDYLRSCGQTDYEYKHSTLCGYVRDKVTSNDAEVTCNLCLREMLPVSR